MIRFLTEENNNLLGKVYFNNSCKVIIEKSIEEMVELMHEIFIASKYKYEIRDYEMKEEIVDVYIMLCQLYKMYFDDYDEFNKIANTKLKRALEKQERR